ncbi:MAG: YceI family protein [Flavobacteriales bacterium]|nr:YceI family protein [Flavobacteriales bacterium]
MKNLVIILLAALSLPNILQAQVRYATRNGHVSFLSETPLENIEATNDKATSVLDVSSGAVEVAVLMKAFSFEKALMQEHFNENYVESDKYPKGIFKGQVTGFVADAIGKPGTYPVSVKGDLTIHGVTKPVEANGSIMVEPAGTLKATTKFIVSPDDFDIRIPGLVRDNIAKQINVMVQIDYQKL